MPFQDSNCTCDSYCTCPEGPVPCGCEGTMDIDPHCENCVQHLPLEQELEWRREQAEWREQVLPSEY